MKIKVLGFRMQKLQSRSRYGSRFAVEELELTGAEVEYVKDMGTISSYIMATPGIVVDEKVVHEGKPLPTYDKVKELLKNKISISFRFYYMVACVKETGDYNGKHY